MRRLILRADIVDTGLVSGCPFAHTSGDYFQESESQVGAIGVTRSEAALCTEEHGRGYT